MGKPAKLSARRKRQKVRTLLRRYGNRCWLCGGAMVIASADPHDPDGATLDHIVPRSQGGTNANPNLRLAHRRCNGLRADAPVLVEARR